MVTKAEQGPKTLREKQRFGSKIERAIKGGTVEKITTGPVHQVLKSTTIAKDLTTETDSEKWKKLIGNIEESDVLSPAAETDKKEYRKKGNPLKRLAELYVRNPKASIPLSVFLTAGITVPAVIYSIDKSPSAEAADALLVDDTFDPYTLESHIGPNNSIEMKLGEITQPLWDGDQTYNLPFPFILADGRTPDLNIKKTKTLANSEIERLDAIAIKSGLKSGDYILSPFKGTLELHRSRIGNDIYVGFFYLMPDSESSLRKDKDMYVFLTNGIKLSEEIEKKLPPLTKSSDIQTVDVEANQIFAKLSTSDKHATTNSQVQITCLGSHMYTSFNFASFENKMIMLYKKLENVAKKIGNIKNIAKQIKIG